MTTPSKTRRWTSLPIPTLHGSEAMDQGSVLEEIRTPLGGVLWRALRDVLLWSGTSAQERKELFSPAAHRVERLLPTLQLVTATPTLKEPFGVYFRMLQLPDKVRPNEISTSCSRISDWAERAGYLATSLAFAQAAAVADPTDGNAAWAAGRLARRRADYYRAKGWFVTAIKRGRDGNQWEAYVLGFAGLGTVAIQRGNLPRAEHYFDRAYRACVSHSVSSRIPTLLHDLMWVAIERGEYERARRYADAAARAYPYQHERLPNFAGDYAYLLLEEGRFADALRVLTTTLRYDLSPAERLIYTGNLARAAGGSGDAKGFQEALAIADGLLLHPGSEEATADAKLSLARGAAMLGDWERAIELASASIHTARERREGRLALVAESFLQSVQTNRSALTIREAAQCDACSVVTAQLLTKLPTPVA